MKCSQYLFYIPNVKNKIRKVPFQICFGTSQLCDKVKRPDRAQFGSSYILGNKRNSNLFLIANLFHILHQSV